MMAQDSESYGCLLQRYRGSSVYFDALVKGGNNGDRLIIAGSSQMRDNAELKYVTDPREADLIIVRGNGVLTDFYSRRGNSYHQRMLSLLTEHPTIPFVLEPSTVRLRPEEFLPEDITRRAETTVYLREWYSWRRLSATPVLKERGVELRVDHDAAFALAGTAALESLCPGRHEDHALVVLRRDIERPWGQLEHSRGKRVLAGIVPRRIRLRARPVVSVVARHAPSGLRREAERIVRSMCSNTDIPYVVADVSDPVTYGFDQFCEIVARSAAVVTTRLHVGVLAGMLGIPTVLIDGPYEKIKGVYEYSMSDMMHVSCLRIEKPRGLTQVGKQRRSE